MQYTTEEFKQIRQYCDAALVAEAYLQDGQELGVEMIIAGTPKRANMLLAHICTQVWEKYTKARGLPLTADSFLAFMTNITELAVKALDSAKSKWDHSTVSKLKRS